MIVPVARKWGSNWPLGIVLSGELSQHALMMYFRRKGKKKSKMFRMELGRGVASTQRLLSFRV